MNIRITTIEKKSLSRPGTGRRAHSRREGMALLFVVSLILFISLLAASFVVVSQQFSASSSARARIEATGDSTRSLVYRAFYDVLRGPEPNNASSPLFGQDVVGDQYGYGVNGTGATVVAGAITGTYDVSFNPFSVIDGSPYVFSQTLDAYAGHVLTLTTPTGDRFTTRVLGYDPTGGVPVFTVLPETPAPPAAALAGSRVVLNGRAFSGWGAGGVTGPMGALTTAAHLPRLMSDSPFASLWQNGTVAARNQYISSGVNESYDAQDYQNMYLAMNDGNNLHASFNRPELFNYLVANFGADDRHKYANFRPFTAEYVRRVVAAGGDPLAVPVNRANGWANPNESLDVDNNGDGVLDSIWMDLGYPVQTDINGRRFKPLVAFMVLDMDNRLNVNAHGNGFHINRNVVFNGNLLGEVDPTSQFFPRGQYLGPPEVSLGPLVNNDPATYAALLTARYGADVLPGDGHLSTEANANIDFRDLWHVYEHRGHPDVNNPFGEVYPNQFVGGLFGTNLDIHGRYTIGIPQVGLITDPPVARPAIDVVSNFVEPANEIASSGYEFKIMPHSHFSPQPADSSDDQPFTGKELERILRRHDRDLNMLPNRLEVTLNGMLTNPQAITTDSYEVPALPSFEDAAGNPISITEHTNSLLRAGGLSQVVANQQLQVLLAPEVRLGLPLDLNRPFGDGRDSNGNNVVDEHWQNTDGAGNPIAAPGVFDEAVVGEGVNLVQRLDIPIAAPVPVDSDGDGLTTNTHLARAVFARHLYVLALLATGDTTTIAPDFVNLPLQGDTARRVRLAQWAINIVDFRDPDSIRTPFEIDVNPFNGWAVDGWLGPGPSGDDTLDLERFVVWGVERPELLISETLVTHDRRSQNDGSGTYENQLVPRSTAFIELFHPWNQNDSNQRLPAELADAGGTGIDLRRTVAASGDPVWRLLVLRNASVDQDADMMNIPEGDVARKIYFVPPVIGSDPNDKSNVGTGRAFSGAKVFYSSFAVNGVVDRGGYAVIGSLGIGTDPVATDGVTFFGRRTGGAWIAELGQTRRVDLNGAARQVSIYHPDDGTNPAAVNVRGNIAAIVIDQPRSLGLSDPDAGYPGTKTEIEDGFQFDTPVSPSADTAANNPQYSVFALNNGVSDGFSSLYLQRLANPLAPYDPVSNPYLTVDAKSLDLIAFNGVENDSSDPNVTSGDMVFAAAERGRLGDPIFGVPQVAWNRRWLWKHDEGSINIAVASGLPHFLTVTDNHFHSRNLLETLGGINGCWTEENTARFPRAASDLNSGANPPMPFTGLVWNNRPFAGHMDVLDVPYWTGYEYLDNYSPYDPSAPTAQYDPNLNIREFGHLPNFYVDPHANFQFEPRRMYAILDYIRVPSRFAGTRVHLTGLNAPAPPFNVVSRYREPGKINLNTLTDVRVDTTVWTGLMNVFSTDLTANGLLMDGSLVSYGFTQVDAGNNGFEGSRRGIAGTGIAAFDNPFRTANEFQKVAPGGLSLASAVDATLLRDEVNHRPIFDYPQVPSAELPFASPTRDSGARHEVFRLLANSTTTRSSVFAIWITVGQFEVDEQGFLRAEPDAGGNYQLVELGADAGKTRRSRGFFLIDRSIPAAYEPGQNHNVDRMILAETIIQ